MNEQELQ
jgi:Ca2+-binding EF-hand superfamily protein